MPDYLQEVRQVIVDDMKNQGIIDTKGEIIDIDGYVDYLVHESNRIQSQINKHQEPGGYYVNMLYKDLDVVREMLAAVEQKQPSHESELIEKFERKQTERKAKIQKLTNGAKHVIRLFGFQRKPVSSEHTK